MPMCTYVCASDARTGYGRTKFFDGKIIKVHQSSTKDGNIIYQQLSKCPLSFACNEESLTWCSWNTKFSWVVSGMHTPHSCSYLQFLNRHEPIAGTLIEKHTLPDYLHFLAAGNV